MENNTELVIDGTSVRVKRKRIKNIYLYVKPPTGDIFISAPTRMSAKEIEAFVIEKKKWIKKQQLRYNKNTGDVKRERLETGGSINLWGNKYRLIVNENAAFGECLFGESCVILSVPSDFSAEKRKNLIFIKYQEILKQAIHNRLPLWEEKTGLHPLSWKIRNMKTRWGSCNTRKRTITFNTQLVQADPSFLDYVILHEITHLKVANHGPAFKAVMDEYMPDWRQRRKELNEWAIQNGFM